MRNVTEKIAALSSFKCEAMNVNWGSNPIAKAPTKSED